MAPKKRRSIINKKKNICLQCKTEVLDSDDAFECDTCHKSLHAQCTKLNKVEMEKLINDDSLEYICHLCQANQNNERTTEFATILKEMREMKETMHFMSLQYDSILKGVKKNTETIKTLKN